MIKSLKDFYNSLKNFTYFKKNRSIEDNVISYKLSLIIFTQVSFIDSALSPSLDSNVILT